MLQGFANNWLFLYIHVSNTTNISSHYNLKIHFFNSQKYITALVAQCSVTDRNFCSLKMLMIEENLISLIVLNPICIHMQVLKVNCVGKILIEKNILNFSETIFNCEKMVHLWINGETFWQAIQFTTMFPLLLELKLSMHK